MNRLPRMPTWRIRPEHKLAFSYAGKAMEGVSGDTVATALFANGVRVFSRSLKYHRPRGLYCLDGETAHTLMEVDGEPHVQAERTALWEGMVVKAQSGIGGRADWDVYAFADRFERFLPAGFYYERFHKPYGLWPFFRDQLRRLSGTGRVDERRPWKDRRLEERYLNAEVCVLGGGPAGLSAALAAAEGDGRVVLLEARPHLGGFYDWRMREYDGLSLHDRARQLAERAADSKNVRVLTDCPLIRLDTDHLVTAFQRGGPDKPFDERYLEIRARSVVVATGCIERPLIFEHNDRPGVMQVGCAWRLARTYGLLPGERAVFSIGDDLGLEAALDLAELGMEVLVVADAREKGQDPELLAALQARNIPLLAGWAAFAAKGSRQVSGVVLGKLRGPGRRQFSCNLIVTSAGQTPVSGALSCAGANMAYDGHTGFYLPVDLPQGVQAAGRLLGYVDPASIEATGRLAGLKAAVEAGADLDLKAAEEFLAGLPGPVRGCRVITGPKLGAGRKSFICFDEDSTLKTARQCVERGFDQPELAKRFGGFGLGPGQSGAPGHNLPLVLAQLTGKDPRDTRPTTVRPPLTPVLMSTLAGPQREVYKRTPLHESQIRQGGLMRTVGVWRRARYFSEDLTCREEIESVRTRAGLIDVSTLGKFRLHGPDALKALQRVYISDMSRMRPGKLKYSAMLNEDGNLIDDGVVVRLRENDYYFTTSTGRAGQTAEWIRYHTRYEGWDFHIVNLTDALGAVNLAGPRARDVLARLTAEDISNPALPFMGYREMFVAGGIPARVSRLGFVGELSYELHVPASYTQALWDRLLEAGAEFGIRPFGLEAQSVLRLEKGHLIIGQESEARTNLLDLGLGFLWAREDTVSGKVGSPALRFSEHQPDRLKLAGLEMDDPQHAPGDGAIIHQGKEITGFVCTCRYSRTLRKAIALALVQAPLAEIGRRIHICQHDGREEAEQRSTATVVRTPFYDPEGRRLRM